MLQGHSKKTNVYCPVIEWSVIYMSNKSFQLILLLSSSTFLLTFCIVVLSFAEGEVLKSPAAVVVLSLSLFNSIVFTSCILPLYCSVHTHLGLLCLLVELSFYHYVTFLIVSRNFLCSIWSEKSHSHIFSLIFACHTLQPTWLFLKWAS